MSCQGFQASQEIPGFSTIGFLGAFNLLKCVEDLQKGNVTGGVHMSAATEPFPKRPCHAAGMSKQALCKMLNHPWDPKDK